MEPMSLEKMNGYIAMSPFIRDWDIAITEADPRAQTLTMRMPWCAEGAEADGSKVWHGGPVASLLDTVGAFAATMVAGRDCGTVSLNIDYVRPATGDLVAKARVRKAGRTLSMVEVDVTNPDGKLCAVGRGVFYVSGA
ncbi:MAG TPA: PaaI family thioesterase [Steroidobacteraceae bacterium]|nr:PaaI family thioesterase [Steroidobacteraceae bacterium]